MNATVLAEASWWALFGDAFVVALLLGASLPLIGVVLVLRRQVFLAVAVGQAANCGMAAAIRCGADVVAHGGAVTGRVVALASGLTFACCAAIGSLRALSRSGGGLEARSAWTFLAAGAAAMLLLADTPHGLQEVQRLFLSSVLGAAPTDVWIALLLAAGVVIALRWQRQRLWLWAIDPSIAGVYGLAVARRDVAVGLAVGAVIAFAIHATGLAFTFGLCVLPVLAAREVARSLRQVVWLAPLLGTIAAAAGFALGDRFDLPPGQCAVVAAAAAVGLARAGRVLVR